MMSCVIPHAYLVNPISIIGSVKLMYLLTIKSRYSLVDLFALYMFSFTQQYLLLSGPSTYLSLSKVLQPQIIAALILDNLQKKMSLILV